VTRVQAAHGGNEADGFSCLSGRFYDGPEFGNGFGDLHGVTLGPAFFPASRTYEAFGQLVCFRRFNHT
jgi:hypothetical protein